MGFKSGAAVAAMVAALFASAAQAAVIDFDDLTGDCDCIAVFDGYRGLDWGGYTLINAPPSFYAPGIHSSPNAVIQAVGGSIFGTANGDDFTFVSAWATGTPFQVSDTGFFVGFRNGVQVESQSFALSPSAPTLLTFNWTVDRVIFNAGNSGGMLDDLTISGLPGAELPTPAPEPSAWALMLAGFGAVGAMMRRGRGPVAEQPFYELRSSRCARRSPRRPSPRLPFS